jgi:hypothetical protein
MVCSFVGTWQVDESAPCKDKYVPIKSVVDGPLRKFSWLESWMAEKLTYTVSVVSALSFF